MKLFEAGIYSKITQDEYQKLREKQSNGEINEEDRSEDGVSTGEDDTELKAMSMSLLQGAFYLLITGHFLSGLFQAL